MSFQPIKRLLPQVVQAHGIRKQIQARQVLETGQTVIRSLWGEDKAKLVLTVSFREGTLKLETESGAAMQQLKIEEVRLTNEINRQLGERVVLRIEVRAKGF